MGRGGEDATAGLVTERKGAAVRGLSTSDRARLLCFATGSSRPPPLGFARLSGFNGAPKQFTLQRVDQDVARLPTATTCFNTLVPVGWRDLQDV